MNKQGNIEPEFNEGLRKNPFHTPDGYFDSLEDRIMSGIHRSVQPASAKNGIIRLWKPILAIAACITLVYLLANYPDNYQGSKSEAKNEISSSSSTDIFDIYSMNIGSIDDNSLAELIFNDQSADSSLSSSDEVLAYLSSGLNEYDIVSEIQNNNP